jgi:cobalt/nickel transport system permease protein
MHIPDGFLSAPVWATLDVAAVPAAGYVVRRAQREFEEKKVPLLGVMGAFVFAAQMINFPVGPGTSGHLVGGALLSYTLGPAAASVVMIAILTIQSLVFQDGGILALGANIFNMAVVGVIVGYLPFHLWGTGPRRKAAIFLGGFFSVLVAALLAISELLLSGIAMSGTVLGVSFALFAVSALLEGAITLAVFQALETLNPNFVKAPRSNRGVALGSLALAAVFLAVVGVLFASTHPDGLEKLAQTLGIASNAKPLLASPLADYQAGFVQSAWLRKAAGGLAGLISIYASCALLGRVIGRQRRP